MLYFLLDYSITICYDLVRKDGGVHNGWRSHIDFRLVGLGRVPNTDMVLCGLYRIIAYRVLLSGLSPS